MKGPLPNEKQKLICLSPKVIERIASLRKAGTTGILLAGKAERVISRLQSGEIWQSGRKIAPRTQHGEKRIRKCVKYDLGWGFRLITLLRHDILYICCLGTHDECDRWLAENSRTQEMEFGRNAVRQVVPRQLKASIPDVEEPSNELDDLDKRLQELPDQTLRRIFSGLVEARERLAQFKKGESQQRVSGPGIGRDRPRACFPKLCSAPTREKLSDRMNKWRASAIRPDHRKKL